MNHRPSNCKPGFRLPVNVWHEGTACCDEQDSAKSVSNGHE